MDHDCVEIEDLRREYLSTGYGLGFSTLIYRSKREKTAFHENLQEACFVLIQKSPETSGSLRLLRKPLGVVLQFPLRTSRSSARAWRWTATRPSPTSPGGGSWSRSGCCAPRTAWITAWWCPAWWSGISRIWFIHWLFESDKDSLFLECDCVLCLVVSRFFE